MRRKTAIITGAARGIGNSTAAALAKNGYDILICATRDIDMAEKDIKNIESTAKESDSRMIYIKADISKDCDRKNIIKTAVEKFGKIDVLVNNAGVAPKVRADILEVDEESYDHVMNINLKGTFFLTQLASLEMIKAKNTREYYPRIINITSMSSYVSSVNRAQYCISKAGASMVTTLFAHRLAEYGIPVYEIRPGIIKTDMTKAVEEKYSGLIDEGIYPIKRWGMPDDVAKAVLAFCSDSFSFSTGEIINVDGGFHIRRL